MVIVIMYIVRGFNPRSRAGSDSSLLGKSRLVISFNPRSRAGSDEEIEAKDALTLVSIHAPARGATL